MAVPFPDPPPSHKGARSIVDIIGAIRVASEVCQFSLLQSRKTASACFPGRVKRRQPSTCVAGLAREQQRLEGEEYRVSPSTDTRKVLDRAKRVSRGRGRRQNSLPTLEEGRGEGRQGLLSPLGGVACTTAAGCCRRLCPDLRMSCRPDLTRCPELGLEEYGWAPQSVRMRKYQRGMEKVERETLGNVTESKKDSIHPELNCLKESNHFHSLCCSLISNRLDL